MTNSRKLTSLLRYLCARVLVTGFIVGLGG